jgi:leader peptidase (prepilin peptidase) / N-methyltransferase
MTIPWIIAGAAAGLLAGPPIRAVTFAHSTEAGQPPRRACPACSAQIMHGRRRWPAALPVTGRCRACRVRIGPYPLAAEAAAGLALAVAAARATSAWELAALAWLALIAVPLAFTDIAVHRLPDLLTATAFAGTLALLAAAALTAHQPGHLARAAIGAAALACFYLVLCLIRPGEMGLGDAKLAASIGLALGWISWQALLSGTFAGFALAAVYGGVLLAAHQATRTSQLPLGPFMLVGALVVITVLRALLTAGPDQPLQGCQGMPFIDPGRVCRWAAPGGGTYGPLPGAPYRLQRAPARTAGGWRSIWPPIPMRRQNVL